ncbi:hypothetical protein AC1031_012788 [Aphanomyces cochlioides]|nr:hypothetical protein AC1031_012788 [Aphanomyces cochlioides]
MIRTLLLSVVALLAAGQSCSSPDYDVDYYGNDIKSTKQSSAEACCNDCKNIAGCVVYTWRNGYCYHKYAKGDALNAPGAVSASVASASNQCGVLEQNTDYPGNDIGSTWQSNPSDCCSDCQSTPGCVVYAWRDGVCYHKSAKGASQYVPGVISVAIPSSERQCGVLEQDTDYPGNDITRTDTNTAEKCCELCSTNPKCVVSVWYNGACYLKDKIGSKVKVKAAKAYRVNSSNKPTAAPTPPPSNGDLGAQLVYQLSIIRQAHGLNAVEYDYDMAKQMQAWADDCSQHPQGGHGGPYGVQNLAPALECGDDCMKQEGPSWWWYDEIKNWDFNSNSCADESGANGGCGHFQNSLGTWVTAMGCGWSSCYNPNIGRNDPLVWCNYRGNGNDVAIPRPKKDLNTIHAELTAAFK